jgi:formyl-CoA transferase
MSAPLEGIRVIEIGNFMATPFAAMQLADLGADVVKLENPDGGDFSRSSAPFIDGESSNFIRLNRNKRSIALDLKAEAGKAAFKRMIARCDVVLENLRPGTMRDLGLGYDVLSKENPQLIYVAASGWGQEGPYASLPGLDIMAQAMSGLMSITGEAGGPPTKVGVPVTDLVAGLYGALAATAALYARRDGAGGQFIDISLFESGVSLAVWEAGKYFATGEIPQRQGSAHQATAPYQAFHASDGYFTAGATTPKNWSAFCKVLDLESIEHEPRFRDSSVRHANLAHLVPLIEAKTALRSAGEWIALLQAAGVPAAPIQSFDRVFGDPHLAARSFFVDAPHRTLGEVRQVGSPMRFSATKTVMRAAGPLLGEHSREVLAEFGFSDGEITELERDRVVVAAVED